MAKRINSDDPQGSTTKGHSSSPTSLSRSFQLFSTADRFIETRGTTCTSRGVRWNFFDELNNSKFPCYNLGELFTHVEFLEQDKKDSSVGVERSGRSGRSYHAIAWVKKLIETSRMHQRLPYTADLETSRMCQRFSYTADIVLDAFKHALVPFQWSLDTRPHGAVLGSFRCKWNLPLFLLEVHSSPYKNSVSHTAANVIEQLRVLQCFNQNVRECVGFTFPKYADDNNSNKTCVTKVTVSFENLKFVVELHPLEIENVETEIVQALQKALTFQADDSPIFCFMRLSDHELADVVRWLKRDHSDLRVEDVEQFPTKHSILLQSSRFFWKLIPRSVEYFKVGTVWSRLRSSSPMHVTLPSSEVSVYSHRLYKFPAQIPPLSKHQVKSCLCDFLMKTATALTELHKFGFAHLDVRIPNICFARKNGDYIVKLIDLDRSRVDRAVDVSGYQGEMYIVPDEWKASQCDWKQLGLLAAKIIFEIDHEAIVCNEKVHVDDCLRSLITEGRWSQAACEQSTNVKKFQKMCLKEVLDQRQPH